MSQASFTEDLSARVRDAQILELINICSEITSILYFDLKHLDIKEDQVNELKTQLKQVETQKSEEVTLFKQNI